MYDLHQLGWYSFQQLALTVAREVFGQTTMAFLSSGDGGRDGSFSGTWKPNDNIVFEGQFVFQCKFTNRVGYTLKFSDLSEEITKVDILVEKGLCDIYILITNAGISGRMSAKLETALIAAGVKHVVVLGATWLNDTIKENIRLRRLVPRIYGLGDLSQILDERVYSQGRTLLEALKDDLAKVVITKSYNKAADALDKHGFVLLIGEPAAGKTTIASLLAMGALDQWKAATMKLDTADQVIKHWNPDDPQQFFWIDDAFGVTQYESNLVHQWNHQITHVRAMLKNGAKIVMTSRDYIYNRARKDLKEGSFPILKESQVVIDVHNLSLGEKRQMLYNHIKMGNQPITFKKSIKPFLEHIASLESFIPETARRLASSFFTKGLFMYVWHLEEFVNKQESFLVDVLSGLDSESLSALALIYMSNDKLSSPLDLKPYEKKAVERLNSSLGGCTLALNSMRGNLVQLVNIEDERFWRFRHPTVGDAFAKYVAKSPELIEIYLQGSPVEKLTDQVTCGDMGIEKAIIVPRSFFPLILIRLKSFTTSKAYKSAFLSQWGARRTLQEFLTRRCSGDFLVQYIEANPKLIDQVASPGLHLDSVPEVSLAHRLFQLNLLPEPQRKKFVLVVSKYASNGDDLYALKSDKIRTLFLEEEFEELRKQIKEQLVPKISTMTKKYEDEFCDSDEPDDHMEPLLDKLRILRDEFEEDETLTELIESEITRTEDWIQENTIEKVEVSKREKLSDYAVIPEGSEERSIFDDIDVS